MLIALDTLLTSGTSLCALTAGTVSANTLGIPKPDFLEVGIQWVICFCNTAAENEYEVVLLNDEVHAFDLVVSV